MASITNLDHKFFFLGLMSLLLSGCTTTPETRLVVEDIALPAQWQGDGSSQPGDAPQEQWLPALLPADLERLTPLVEQALAHNQSLQISAYDVEIKQRQLTKAAAALLPSLDVSLHGSRRKAARADGASLLSTDYQSALDFQYELDLWGKLSDSERQANLNYLAERQYYQQARLELVAEVLISWYEILTDQQLLSLYQQRVSSSRQNLQIIESGYRQGLNGALDVYLARNELNNELAKVAEQQQALAVAKRQLAVLCGGYPQTAIDVEGQLPLLTQQIAVGIPSELIKRKADISASWYRLLATDAALAYAHKQRFPSFTIRADLSKGGSQIQDWLSGALGWSLLGSLTAPLFDAGRLEANEAEARIRLRQSEQQYVQQLYQAFSSVENGLSNEQSLKQQYQAMLRAEQSALAAQSLSFEQYQRGLISYTTVLDAQTRAYQAQSSVIQLKNRLLANRIHLHVALGGDFSSLQVKP